jgi:hypothetical protein
MKTLIFAVSGVFAVASLSAQMAVWQPSPGHTQAPIWPGRVPEPQPVAGPEFAETTAKPWMDTGGSATGVSNLSRPTMTIYSTKGNNTGTPYLTR